MFELNEKHFMPTCPHSPTGKPPHEKPRYTITEEIEHTAREMRNTIDRLLRFEERCKKEIDDLLKNLTADNVIFKNTFSEGYNTFLQEVKNEVNIFEGNINSAFQLFKNDLETNYSGITDNVNVKMLELKESIQEQYNSFVDAVNERIDNNNNAHSEAIVDFKTKVTTELNMFTASINNSFNTFTEGISENVTDFKNSCNELITRRLAEQDAKISDNELYMKTNLHASLSTLLGDMKDSGEFMDIVEAELFTDLSNKIKGMNVVSAQMFGAIGDGTTDDTTALQQVIDYASEHSVVINFPDGVYLTTGLTLHSNSMLNLGTATLKLAECDTNIFTTKDNESYENIVITGGTIDCNKAVNHNTNLSGGGIYLYNVNKLVIDTKIVNCAREGFYLTGCENVKIIIDYLDGGFDTSIYYGYGGTLDNCNRVVVENSLFKNIFGYGVHVLNSENVVINNCIFDTIRHENNGIGITLTYSDNVKVLNNTFKNCYAKAVECNASKNVRFDKNYIVASKSGYVFGDNGSGGFNDNIVISNERQLEIQDYSYSLNWINSMIIENVFSNRNFTTLYDIVSLEIIIRNSKFVSNIPSVAFYKRFMLKNVKFSDITINESNQTAYKMKAKQKSISQGDTFEYTFPCGDDFTGGNLLKITFCSVGNMAQKKVMTAPCVLCYNNMSVGELQSVSIGYDFPVSVGVGEGSKTIAISNQANVDLLCNIELM